MTALASEPGSRPRDERLRPGDRIKRRSEFREAQTRGRRISTPHFVIVVKPRTEGETRIGITVTKKVAGAVGRNRVKRVVREVFRRQRARFPEGCDVVLIAREGADALSYAQVAAELDGVAAALVRAARRSEAPSRDTERRS